MTNKSGDHGFTDKKILIIEESPQQRDTLISLCCAWGASTVSGSSCKEAFLMAIKERPNLIIIHPGKEKRSGIYTCKVLKSLPLTREIPILITTSESFPSRGLFHHMYIFDDFIEKPFSDEDLVEKVMKIFSSTEQ